MKSRAMAAAAALTLALTACGGGGSGGAADGPKRVTIWMYPVISDTAKSQSFWGEVEKSFESANPGIDLAIELQPWDGRDEKVATALASGKGPDLVLMTPDQLPQHHANGGVKSLKGALDADRDKFVPSGLKAATVGSDTYAVPIYHTVITPVYNKKVLADAGVEPPSTWDDLRAAAPKLAAKGVTLMDYSGDPKTTLNQTFYPLLWQAGGTVFAKDGKAVAFNGPEGRKALHLLVDLKKANGLPADAATKAAKVEGSGLTNGKVAMTYSAVKADAVTMGKGIGPDNVGVVPPFTDAKQVTFGLPGLLARTSISKDEASAVAVAKFIASADTQTKLSAASGFFPARTDAKPSDDELSQAFTKSLQFANPGEAHPKSRQVMAALAPHLQAALQGNKTPEAALADAEKEANELVRG